MPNYSSIISKSIDIVKRYKWIWVYGVALAIFAGGGSGSGGNYSSSNTSKVENVKDIPGKSKEVLGAMTSGLLDWFHSVPAEKWLLFIVLGIALIIFGIILSMVARAWATSGLIYSIDMALDDKEVTLTNTSTKVFKYIKRMIGFGLYSSLLAFVISFGSALLLVILFAVGQNIESLKIILTVLVVITAVVGLIYLIIAFALTNIIGQRLIVLEKMKVVDAWKKAFLLARKHLGSGVLMGIIGGVLGMIITVVVVLVALIILAIPALIVFYPYIQTGTTPNVLSFVFVGMEFLLFIFLMRLVAGIMYVFKFSNWNQFVRYVLEKEAAK